MVSDGRAIKTTQFSCHHVLDRQVSTQFPTLDELLTPRRKPTVWINDAWAAHDILVKRAGIYCSRPRNLIFAELGAGQWNMLNMYTITKAQRERFRDHRKLTHLGVGIQQVKNYQGFQDDESKVMTCDLLSSPNEFVAHFERWATSVVSTVAFGRRISKVDDPLITEVLALMHNAAEMAVVAKDLPRLMETLPCECP